MLKFEKVGYDSEEVGRAVRQQQDAQSHVQENQKEVTEEVTESEEREVRAFLDFVFDGIDWEQAAKDAVSLGLLRKKNDDEEEENLSPERLERKKKAKAWSSNLESNVWKLVGVVEGREPIYQHTVEKNKFFTLGHDHVGYEQSATGYEYFPVEMAGNPVELYGTKYMTIKDFLAGKQVDGE